MYHNRYAARTAERHPIATALAVIIFGLFLLAGAMLVFLGYLLVSLLTFGRYR